MLVKFTRRGELHGTFNDLMTKVKRFRDQFPSPIEALSSVIEGELGKETSIKVMEVFGDWLSGYTWNKVFSGFFPGASYTWETVTKNVLKRGIPK